MKRTEEERQCAERFHPTEYIEDEIKERGWTFTDFVIATGATTAEDYLSWELYMHSGNHEILLGKDGCEGLSRAFGTSAQMWRNLEDSYRNWTPPKGLTQ